MKTDSVTQEVIDKIEETEPRAFLESLPVEHANFISGVLLTAATRYGIKSMADLTDLVQLGYHYANAVNAQRATMN